MKKCLCCKKEKSLNDYYKGKVYYQSYCKVCQKQKVKERTKKVGSRSYWSKKFQHKKRKSKLQGVEFNLSLNDYIELFTGKNCFYCRKPVQKRSLDRINPAIGYIKNNAVLACSYCNRMKSNFKKKDLPVLRKIIEAIEDC